MRVFENHGNVRLWLHNDIKSSVTLFHTISRNVVLKCTKYLCLMFSLNNDAHKRLAAPNIRSIDKFNYKTFRSFYVSRFKLT